MVKARFLCIVKDHLFYIEKTAESLNITLNNPIDKS